MSVAWTTWVPFWYPVIVDPTTWIFHTSVAAVIFRVPLALSWVQLEALSIRHSDTVLVELPYQRK